MDLLRFFTAGNVDDGKSTLIGRLLYDSNSISTDILETLTQQSKTVGTNTDIDLALLTDGLRAEREQGITIDVAYKFFSTAKRKFIVADTPGHAQYTRNMFTGGSTAELAIILVDARHGVTEQTKRHSIICSVLGIPRVLVCVNKMDLVDFSSDSFHEIQTAYAEFATKIGLKGVDYIPVSALNGDNVVHASDKLAWYTGETLFNYLENVPVIRDDQSEGTRFRVQYVIRPQTTELHDYRGYAGSVLSGKLAQGQRVKVYPSNQISEITKIEYNQQEVKTLESGLPGVIHLADDLDISRGATIIPETDNSVIDKQIDALICWMDTQALQAGQKLVFQQQSFRTKAMIKELVAKIDIHSYEAKNEASTLALNELAKVEIKLAEPILRDSFDTHPNSGSFILINEATNNTVAGGIII